MISSGSIDEHKEREIPSDFLNDMFCELLGYSRAVDNPKRYTISREKHVQFDGKFADAVLGGLPLLHNQDGLTEWFDSMITTGRS